MNNTSTNSFSVQALDSADNFRSIMEAMARPGRLVKIASTHHGINSLNAGAFMVATTLCDHETPVWLDDALQIDEIVETLKFQCSCPIKNEAEAAAVSYTHLTLPTTPYV